MNAIVLHGASHKTIRTKADQGKAVCRRLVLVTSLGDKDCTRADVLRQDEERGGGGLEIPPNVPEVHNRH